MAEVTLENQELEKRFSKRLIHSLLQNSVTILFLIVCIAGIYVSKLPIFFIANELLTRVTRNTFLVLALIIPVMAGMGLNFSIVVGAMAGQMAIVAVTNWGIGGIAGTFLAFAISAPIALIFGKATGVLLNKTKGQEMIASMIVGYFANGLYQLLFLFMVGPIIPIAVKGMLLSSGIGLRNTIDLAKNGDGVEGIKYALDGATFFGMPTKVPFFYVVLIGGIIATIVFAMRIAKSQKIHISDSEKNKNIINVVISIGLTLFSVIVMFAPQMLSKQVQMLARLKLPLVTAGLVLLLAGFNLIIVKTKLGQDFRAVGQNKHIAQVSGIKVNKTRELAIMLSTMFAGWGQIIFLQNLGILNTYGSHVQIALFAIAAILIGGASVSKATVGQAFLGVILFHTLFIVSPMAGKNLFGEAQIGEFFRAFVAYGVIGVSLGLHAWKKLMMSRA